MNYDYDEIEMQKTLAQIVAEYVSPEEWSALEQKSEKFGEERKTSFFNLTFTAIPRLLRKKEIIHVKHDHKLQKIRKGFSISGWTSDQLVRIWWLLHFPSEDQSRYFKQMESLFKSAEMNEQVALYSALPLLAFPEVFRQRASEGLRTNIRQVFEAIALDNPYPVEYFDEAAWNQMVLKSFFMNVAVNRIAGLDEKANATLAHILSDYAHERWAAGRPVNPLLWRPVSQFIDEVIMPDIQKLFHSEDEKESKAAALACYNSNFEPAKKELKRSAFKSMIEKGELTWKSIE